MAKIKLTMKQKHDAKGYLFVLPFILGLLLIFLVCLGTSLKDSFFTFIRVDGIAEPKFVWFENYWKALRVDPDFVRIMLTTVGNMLLNLPIILIFSFFAANLLNQKFIGRSLARAIFFFPVIASIGIIASFNSGDLLMGMMATGGQQSSSMMSSQVKDLLLQTNLNHNIVGYITGAVDRIYQIVNMSGVQILVALSGLQSVSHSLYESADIDGATGWEKFWKITFPMMGPILIVNGVYTIIDLLTQTDNQLMTMIKGTAFNSGQYGFANAMSWIYFLVITVILCILVIPISRKVFYQE